MSSQYNTQLNPSDEWAYREWVASNLAQMGLTEDAQNPNNDYDYRGFYKTLLKPEAFNAAAGTHFTDQFKKPNHPSFSNESQYATGSNAARAGSWGNNDAFNASSPDQWARYIMSRLGEMH